MESFRQSQNPLSYRCFDMFNRKSFVDVALFAEGKCIQAHKLVLAAASNYFEEIFDILPDKHPAIVLNNITFEQLEKMLQYVYCGTVDILSDEVESFRKLLESMLIDFDQEQDEAGDEEEMEQEINNREAYDDDDDEPEIIEPVQEIIDVEDPTWGDVKVKIKDEPNDEPEESNFSNASKEKPMSQPQTNNVRPSTSKSIPTESFRRLIRFPPSFLKPQKIIRLLPTVDGKISVNRVVPSKHFRDFMQKHPTICPFCHKLFKTTKHRNEHVKYCFDNPDRVVSTCPLCNKSVCDPYYLRKHLRNVHGKSESTTN